MARKFEAVPGLPLLSLAFDDCEDLVRFHARDLVYLAAGPVDFYIRLRRFVQAEVDAQVALRDITAAAAHFVHLRVLAFRLAEDARAYT